MTITQWLPFNKDLSKDKYRLFCFAHSGVGASVFHPWLSLKSHHLEICPVQLPGRESRYREQHLTNMTNLMDELEKVLSPLVNHQTAFFGHSLGGYIAFECAKKFNKKKITTFISAVNPPNRRNEKSIRELPNFEFLQEISNYGGISTQIFQDKELQQIILPTLRADITLYETYSPKDFTKIRGDMIVIGGLEDPFVTKDNLLQWSYFSSGFFCHYLLPGNHFFYQQRPKKIIEIIESHLFKSDLGL